MRERTGSRELPLIFFTLALQLSSGLVLALTLCGAEADPTGIALLQPLAVAAFAVAVLGLMASVLHLGRPLSAWRSLRNLRHSRLSLEILFTGLYTASSAGLAWAWRLGDPQLQLWSGVATSLLGVAAVVASAAVYMLAGQPAWNARWVPISFLGTMLTLGGAAAAAFLTLLTAKARFVSPASMMLVGAALVIASAEGLRRSSRHVQVAVDTLPGQRSPLTSGQRYMLGLHIALVGILPFTVIAQMVLSSMGFVSPLAIVALAALGIVISGAFLGRALMYSLAKDAF
jgi:DMSO reductase anchor subunit